MLTTISPKNKNWKRLTLWSVNKQARTVTKWTSLWHTTTRVMTSNSVMWSIADRDCFRILILLKILNTSNRILEAFFVSSRVERSFPQWDVQETNFSFTQSYWIWGCILRCRLSHGQSSRFWSLANGWWSITFVLCTDNTSPYAQHAHLFLVVCHISSSAHAL